MQYSSTVQADRLALILIRSLSLTNTEKMQTTANDITEMEDNFARWQATLIKQQDDERKLYAKENAQKHAVLAKKV